MKFFLHQIKHNSTNDTYDKGIVVKDSFDAASQSYHAYLGAYAYGQSPTTDFVSTMITSIDGGVIMQDAWGNPEPESESELEPELG